MLDIRKHINQISWLNLRKEVTLLNGTSDIFLFILLIKRNLISGRFKMGKRSFWAQYTICYSCQLCSCWHFLHVGILSSQIHYASVHMYCVNWHVTLLKICSQAIFINSSFLYEQCSQLARYLKECSNMIFLFPTDFLKKISYF